MRKLKPAVFLDRDGTLIHEGHYLCDPARVRLYAGAARAVKKLNEAGFLVFILTNQSGVARGFFTEEDVRRVNRHVVNLLRRGGAKVDAVYYCPHYPKGPVKRYARACACRKPEPGMVEKAARRFPVDRKRSFSVGDHDRDVLLARKARLGGAVHLATGHGREESLKLRRAGIRVPAARNIRRAVQLILRMARKAGNGR